MSRFKGVAYVLVILMILSTFQFSVYASTNFSDTVGHWGAKAIDRWSTYGVVTGDSGQFRPNAPITRGEMAAILDKIMRFRIKAVNTFSDLDENWYTDPILKVNSAGIMIGSDNKVRPKDNITRQEAAVLICRALDIPENFEKTSGFVDDKEIGPWALGYVNAMAHLGYISGVGGNRFAPRDNITRAAAVAIFDNAIKALYQKEGTYSGNVEGVMIVASSGSVLKDMNISGDIIVSEGVGDGEVVLDSVKVEGTLIVRGGGVNSIIIKNSSLIPKIIVNRRDGVVAVKVDGDSAEVGHISVLSNGAVISAPRSTVAVAEGVTGALVNGKLAQPGDTVLAMVDTKDEVKVSPSIPIPTKTKASSSNSGSSNSGTDSSKPKRIATAIGLDTEAAIMDVAEILELIPILTPLDAETDIEWQSSDTAIATVNADGLVMASSEGTVTITASTENGLTGTCFIAISAPENLIVNYPGTIINGGLYNNVTIAGSVGEGNVTFNNVIITGKLTVNGGGSASIHFNGNSNAKEVVVSKTTGNKPRFLMNDAASVSTFDVSGAAGAILERGQNATGSISTVSASKPLTIKNAEVPEISTSSELELDNAEVNKVATTGELATIKLKGETKLDKLEAGGKTKISADSTGSRIEEISTENAEVETDDKSEVGSVIATGAAKITVNGPTEHIQANGGDISVSGNCSPVIRGDAGTVSISGKATPIMTANAQTIEVAAGNGAGITVTGTVNNINTTGTGNIGAINIEKGTPEVSIAAGIQVEIITVSGVAAPTVQGAGTADKLVSISNGIVTVNIPASTLIAKNIATITGSKAQNVSQANFNLDSITLDSKPLKLVYSTTDSNLDLTGMIVTGNYSVSGSDVIVKKVLAEGDYDVTGWPTSKNDGIYPIKVEEKSAYKRFAVFSIQIFEKRVAGILLSALPIKLRYEIGEPLDLTGGKLTVYYTNKSLYPSEEIVLPHESVSYTGYTNTKGDKYITLTYDGRSAMFPVIVNDREFESLTKARLVAEIELIQFTSDKLKNNSYSETAKAEILKIRDSGITKIKETNDQNAIELIKNQTIKEIDVIKTLEQQTKYEIMVDNVGYSDLQTAIDAASNNQIVEIISEYNVLSSVTIPTGKTVINHSEISISDGATVTVKSGAVFANKGGITLFFGEVYNEELGKAEILGSCLYIEEGGSLNLSSSSDILNFHGGDYIRLDVKGTLNAEEGATIIVLGGSVTGVEGIETEIRQDDMGPYDRTGVYRYNGILWQRLENPDLDGFDVSIKSDGNMVIRSKVWKESINIRVDDEEKRLISKNGIEYLVTGNYNDGELHKVFIWEDGRRYLMATAIYIDSGIIPGYEKLASYDYRKYFFGGAFVTVAGEVEVDGNELLINDGVTIDIANGGSIDFTDKILSVSPSMFGWTNAAKNEIIVRYGGSIKLENGKIIGSDTAADMKLGEYNYAIISANEPKFSDNPEEKPMTSRLYVVGGMGEVEIPINKAFILQAEERLVIEPDTVLLVNGELSSEAGALLAIKSNETDTACVEGTGSGISGIGPEGEYIWGDSKWQITKRFKANRMDVMQEIYKNFSKGFGFRMPETADVNLYSGQYADWSYIEENQKEAVAFLIKNNIIQGTEEGMLDPYGKIDRAGLTIAFNRLLDSMGIKLEERNPDIVFTDVLSTDYFYDAVMTMAKAYIVYGMPNGPESQTLCFMPYASIGIEPLEFEGGRNAVQILVERLRDEIKNNVVNRYEVMRSLYEKLKEGYGLQQPSQEELVGYASQYVDWDDLIVDWYDQNRFSSVQEQIAENEAMVGFFVKNGIADQMAFGNESQINVFEPLTKAEIMVFLDIVSKAVMKDAQGVLPAIREIAFEDVEEADWFYGGVINMARAGFMDGKAMGTQPETFMFYPYNLVSRRNFGWGSEQSINLENFFMAIETVMPKTEVTGVQTYEALSAKVQMVKNLRFTDIVTVTGEENGRIDFLNCEFEQGLTVIGGARYEVSLGKSVTQQINVEGDTTLIFDDTKEVLLRDIASGTAVNVTNARAAVECKESGGNFTLNGAVINAGEFDENPIEFTDDNSFYASVRWNCTGDHGFNYEGDHTEHVGQSVYAQASVLEFRGAILTIDIDNKDEFVGFDMQGNTNDVVLNIIKTTPVAGGEINIGMPNQECDKRLIVKGNLSSNNVTVSGRVDVSGLNVDGENQIRIGSWPTNTNAVIGSKTVYVVGNENVVPISAQSGAKVIVADRNIHVNVNEGALDVGLPHIFDNEGNYQIYLGIGDDTDFTFTLTQGESLEYTIDKEYAQSDNKLHLVPEVPIVDLQGINLEVQKDGITVIYENLEFKQ